MGRRGAKAKADTRGRLQRIYDRDHADDATPMDATPERLAKEEGHAIEEVRGESNRISKARRFARSHLDRLGSAFTDRQYQAGDWYRETHARCRYALCVTAAYGERVGGGDPTSGLPRTEAQADARRQIARARHAWPAQMRVMIDRFLIDDEMPLLRGRARGRYVAHLAQMLDVLADQRERPVSSEEPLAPS